MPSHQARPWSTCASLHLGWGSQLLGPGLSLLQAWATGGQGWPSLRAVLAGGPRQLSWRPWKLGHLWEQARGALWVLLLLLLHLLLPLLRGLVMLRLRRMLRLLQVSVLLLWGMLVLLLMLGGLLWGLLIGALEGQLLWTHLLVLPLQSHGMLALMLALTLKMRLMRALGGGVVHGARVCLQGGCWALGRWGGAPRGWRGWDCSCRLLRLSSWVPPPCSPGVAASSSSSSSSRSWGAGARRLLLSRARTGLQVACVRAPARVAGRSPCRQHGTQPHRDWQAVFSLRAKQRLGRTLGARSGR